MRTEELLKLAREATARPGEPAAVLGLAGPPGTGKSTLATVLCAGLRERYGPHAAGYAPMDGFHLSNVQLGRLGLTDRKGAPQTFDVDGYAALLARLAAPGAPDVYCPDFDRELDEPVAARHVVTAGTRLVITEGNYLACELPGWDVVRTHLTLLWYVETPPAVRRKRLVERQLAGGREKAAAEAWVAGNDWPNTELVHSSRDSPRVDRLVHWSGHG